MKDIKDYLEQTNTVLLTKDAFELLKERASVQPCEDAISRQAVLDTLDTSDRFMDEDRTVETYKELLKECYEVLPSVTPKQKMGRWIWKDGYRGIPYCNCSECGNGQWEVSWNYCPFVAQRWQKARTRNETDR